MQCCVLEFIFKVVDSLFKVLSLAVITLETGSANILNRIAEMIIEVLVTDKVPDFYGSSGVMSG